MPVLQKKLEQSLVALREYFSPSRKQEGIGNVAQLVLFAEHAAKNGCGSVAWESLELYHSLDPPTNQFLIRAHLCKAMLTGEVESERGTPTEAKLGQALDFILKAVSIASKSECYFFLIYNASLLMWRVCRPFQRPGSRRCFARPLRVMVKALDDCVREEYEWKLELFMSLILSQLDAGLKDDAARTCNKAILLANKHVPHKLLDLVRLQASHNLGDLKAFDRDIRQSPVAMFLFKLNKIRYSVNYNGLCGAELESKLSKLYKSSSREGGSHTPRTSTTRSHTPPLMLGDSHGSLFLEFGNFCSENSLYDLAQDCLKQVPKSLLHNDAKLLLCRELLHSQLLVARQDGGDQVYTKESVEARIKVISRLEEVLKSALRLGDSDVIQDVCVALWNISLPLLQHNLRHLLHKPLTQLVSALEGMQSLLYDVRLTAHLELAKICAQLHQLQTALDHLQKAQLLDTDDKYVEQIKHHLHRFTLRAQIYEEPDASTDKAAKLIEQCEEFLNKGEVDDVGALLVKAGNILAPDCFSLAMDGSPLPRDPSIVAPESEGSQTVREPVGEPAGGPVGEPAGPVGVLFGNTESQAIMGSEGVTGDGQETVTTEVTEILDQLETEVIGILIDKGRKLEQYKAVRQHAKKYLSDLGTVDMAKRCQVWGDLAKMARKSGAWEVAMVAASFCVEHNADDRTGSSPLKGESSRPSVAERFSSPLLSQGQTSSASSKGDRMTSPYGRRLHLARESSTHSHSDESRHKEELNLIRTLAEVHCVLAECYIYQLKQEKLNLGQEPNLTATLGPVSPAVASEDSWLLYTEWSIALTKATWDNFLKAAKIGAFLGEPHLVSNAAVYLWNYNQHLLQSNRLGELVPTFKAVLVYLRKLPKHSDKEMIVRMCTVIAQGIAKKWVPTPSTLSQTVSRVSRSAKKSAKGKSAKKKGGGDFLQMEPDAIPELKEAVEVCDYAMGVGTGVSLTLRKRLLAACVLCKQMLHQPISSNTYDVSELSDGCTKHCRAMVAMEMVIKQTNGIWEFPNPPTIQMVFSLLSDCEWAQDYILELELWTVLAKFALEQNVYDLVTQCTDKAITVQQENNPRDLTRVSMSLTSLLQRASRHRPPLNSVLRLESELMSQVHSLQGQAMLARAGSGCTAGATRQALEAFLESGRFAYDADNLELVLLASSHYWNSSLSLSKDPMERGLLRDPLSELLNMMAPLLSRECSGSKITLKTERRELLLSMYGVVFQAYIDNHSWEDGLKAVEAAIGAMPKELYHNLLHYKIIFKSRLGRGVESDMIKFQDEPELVLASLWHTAAVNAKVPSDKLDAYQRAIQTLKAKHNPWVKAKYLLELGEWLYRQPKFSLQDALDQFQQVVLILLSLREKPPATESADPEVKDEGGEDERGDVGEVKREDSEGQEEHDLPSTTPLSLDPVVPSCSTVSSVAQLEALLRVHIMMAELHGLGSQLHFDLSVAALAYCSLIWKLVYNSFSKFDETYKLCQRLPSSPKDWAEFQLPEKMLEYLQSSQEIGTLNKATIQEPVLTLYCLDVLVDSLRLLGLHPLALPVLNLQLAIAMVTLPNNNALPKLYHMRLAMLCVELHLPSGLPVHNVFRSPILVPDDFASSRVEMEVFRAKREVLEKEESRRTVVSTKNVTFAKSAESWTQQPQGNEQYQGYRVGEEVVTREVWVKQARLLVEQGQYSSAHELLNLAKTESECFDDLQTLFLAHITSGLLAMAEKDSELAIFTFVKALELPCQLDGLTEGALHLSEAILGNTDYRSQHTEVMEHILDLVQTLGRKQWDSSPMLSRTVHLLKARVAVCSLMTLAEGSLSSHTRDNISQVMDDISDSTDLLLKGGHYRETSQILTLTGRVSLTLGERHYGLERQEYILQSLALHQKALDSLQTCYVKVCSTCQPLNDVTLPVEAELVRTQFDIAEILLLVFSEHSAEQRATKNIDQGKSGIEKVIDDYVRESPVLTSVARDWFSTATLACDRVLGLLTSAHSLAKSNYKLKAKCTYLLGQCFSLMAEHASPDPSQQWVELVDPAAEVDTEGNEEEEEEPAQQEQVEAETGLAHKYSTVSMVVRQQEADAAEVNEAFALRFASQAVHTLTEAVSLAVASKQWELGVQAALRLVDTVGLLDPPLSALYLAFYQSLAFSVQMKEFLCKLQSDPETSALGALLCQRERLTAHTFHDPPAVEENTALLSTFEVFKSLSVASNHLELLKNFPPHFRFIVLQHSQDKAWLYAAYLIPPQPPPPSAHKKSQQPPEIEPLEPVVCSVEVFPDNLQSLLGLMAEYREAACQNMCNPVSDGKDVELLLTEVSATLATYLADVLPLLSTALSKENANKELSVVILADLQLLSLPLEMLPLFQKENICSVSRDFSLQMLQHRMTKNTRESSVSSGKASETKKREKHPPLPPPSLPVSVHSFKYVLDPSNSMEGKDKNESSRVLAQIRNFPKLTGKWTGFTPEDTVMSLGEWPSLLKECTGLIFFGTERFLAHLPANILASLSLSGCSFAAIFDSMSTHQSNLRQANLDLHKSDDQLYYEQPLQTAMLLSMAGVGSIWANQWYTTVGNNVDRTNLMIKELLSEGKSIGRVLWLTKIKPKEDAVVVEETGEARGSIVPEKSSAIYNCVLYGLPHLTIQEATK